MTKDSRFSAHGSSGRRPRRDLLSEAQWRLIAENLELSNREFQIVQSIFDGQKQCAIARELGIAAKTVGAYTERLYHKLDVHDRCELIVRIFEAYISIQSVHGGPQDPPHSG